MINLTSLNHKPFQSILYKFESFRFQKLKILPGIKKKYIFDYFVFELLNIILVFVENSMSSANLAY